MTTDVTRRSLLGATLAGSAGLALPGNLMAKEAARPTVPVDTTSGKMRGLRRGGL